MPFENFSNWWPFGETKTKYFELFQTSYSQVHGELTAATTELEKVMRKLGEVFQLADHINNEGVSVLCHDCGRKRKLKSPNKDSFFLCSHTSEPTGVKNPRPQSSGVLPGKGRAEQETLINSLLEGNDRLRSENQALNTKLQTMEIENRDMKYQIDSLGNQIEMEKRRSHELKTENGSYRSTTETLRKRINEIETECTRGKSEIATFQEEVLCLQSEIAQLKERAKHSLVLSIHTNLKSSLALPAQEHIEQCLKEKFEASGMGLQTRPYDPADPTAGPTLVLCMNVSRLGTDVKEAVKGTTGNQDVVVVVLHHKEVHALPNQSSDRALIGEEYRRLGAIVDAAFLTGRGMYECDMNRQAIEKIFTFLKTFLTQKG